MTFRLPAFTRKLWDMLSLIDRAAILLFCLAAIGMKLVQIFPMGITPPTTLAFAAASLCSVFLGAYGALTKDSSMATAMTIVSVVNLLCLTLPPYL